MESLGGTSCAPHLFTCHMLKVWGKHRHTEFQENEATKSGAGTVNPKTIKNVSQENEKRSMLSRCDT
eukprot:3580297-Amphidinium_carterae.1